MTLAEKTGRRGGTKIAAASGAGQQGFTQHAQETQRRIIACTSRAV
jgi:hypothetical protein